MPSPSETQKSAPDSDPQVSDDEEIKALKAQIEAKRRIKEEARAREKAEAEERERAREKAEAEERARQEEERAKEKAAREAKEAAERKAREEKERKEREEAEEARKAEEAEAKARAEAKGKSKEKRSRGRLSQDLDEVERGRTRIRTEGPARASPATKAKARPKAAPRPKMKGAGASGSSKAGSVAKAAVPPQRGEESLPLRPYVLVPKLDTSNLLTMDGEWDSDPSYKPGQSSEDDEDMEDAPGPSRKGAPKERGQRNEAGEIVKMGGENACYRCLKAERECLTVDKEGVNTCAHCHETKQGCRFPRPWEKKDQVLMWEQRLATEQLGEKLGQLFGGLMKEVRGLREEVRACRGEMRAGRLATHSVERVVLEMADRMAMKGYAAEEDVYEEWLKNKKEEDARKAEAAKAEAAVKAAAAKKAAGVKKAVEARASGKEGVEADAGSEDGSSSEEEEQGEVVVEK